MEFVVLLVIWGGLSFAVGSFWQSKGLDKTTGLVVSLLLSPVLGFVIGLLMNPPARQSPPQEQAGTVPAPSVASGPAKADSKKCPYCAEFIKSEAVLCRYCGKDQPPVTTAPSSPSIAEVMPAAQSVPQAPSSATDAPTVHQFRVAEPRKGISGGFVVGAIMVLGAAVAIAVGVSGKGDEDKVKQAKTDLHTLENCLDLYKIDRGRYPSTEEGLQAVVTTGKCKAQLKDPWQHPYVYLFPGQVHPESFDLLSYGADGQKGGEGINADIVNP